LSALRRFLRQLRWGGNGVFLLQQGEFPGWHHLPEFLRREQVRGRVSKLPALRRQLRQLRGLGPELHQLPTTTSLGGQ